MNNSSRICRKNNNRQYICRMTNCEKHRDHDSEEMCTSCRSSRPKFERGDMVLFTNSIKDPKTLKGVITDLSVAIERDGIEFQYSITGVGGLWYEPFGGAWYDEDYIEKVL